MRERFTRFQWRRQHRRLLRAYLAACEHPKLHLGTGKNVLKGWLNTDLDPEQPETALLDARLPFPFPDGSFELVFTEHLIEHLTLEEGARCLRECFRVLRPGGRIRVATPSLERLALLFLPDPSEEQRRYVQWATDHFLPEVGAYEPGYVLNNFFRSWGHHFIYDSRTLTYALARAGFEDIHEFAPGVSSSPDLAGLEGHAAVIGREANDLETIVLEARRPPSTR